MSKEKNRPEVLAPAGSMDALRAAVLCGADAVYLGAERFSARRNAVNFSAGEESAAAGRLAVGGGRLSAMCGECGSI